MVEIYIQLRDVAHLYIVSKHQQQMTLINNISSAYIVDVLQAQNTSFWLGLLARRCDAVMREAGQNCIFLGFLSRSLHFTCPVNLCK